MASRTSARVFVAGSSRTGRPGLARIDVDGDAVEIVAREYVDPMVRSGRGGSSGAIAALSWTSGPWLLAAVERGRPRLIDPETLGVVALLGRRREWRAAAKEGSPFLPVICDRAPVSVGGRVSARFPGHEEFSLARSPGGVVDLVSVRPGEPIERWCLGLHASRVELLGGDGMLGFWSGARLAMIELAELVPGGCPLLDPRDVDLPLRWVALPSGVVGVCDLRRVIERHGDRWTITELDPGGASWTIDRPERWLARGGHLWLAHGEVWTRIEAGRGPVEQGRSLARAMSPAAVEIDAGGHPWLWLCEQSQLSRVDGLALAEGPVERWAIDLGDLRVQQVLVATPGAAPDRSTILHADELAELLAFEPELGEAWRGWFEGPST